MSPSGFRYVPRHIFRPDFTERGRIYSSSCWQEQVLLGYVFHQQQFIIRFARKSEHVIQRQAHA
eukprot:scaffold2686_cov167-Amphora_coffeaeformis.AAC.3